MYEISRFWTAYSGQILFLLAICIGVYALARFASARWPFALIFACTPIYIYGLYQENFWRDLMRLFS